MVVCPVAGLDDGATAGPRLVVIGCGCLNRSDDAAGVHAIRRLREHFAAALPAGVELFDAGTGGIEVMFNPVGALPLLYDDKNVVLKLLPEATHYGKAVQVVEATLNGKQAMVVLSFDKATGQVVVT